MTFIEIIYTILIKPLELFFEVLFMVVNNKIKIPGISIMAISLIMNILILPLYMRADAMQEAERELEARIHKGVAHIKKTFKGDERMMMLQTYYRQNDYKPTDVFKGSVSLLLEIPFFIAAYQFLSNLSLLKGSSFGPIGDLGAPDALLSIGTVSINILPIIMTAVNLVSCIIFTKGSPGKTKAQLYGMAVFFLVFLYRSPAGLVFYWTLNNIFSLVKTIFYKLKHPGRILKAIAAIAGLFMIYFAVQSRTVLGKRYLVLIMVLSAVLLAPAVWDGLKFLFHFRLPSFHWGQNRKVFLTGTAYLTVLTGIAIPSSVIAASPQEFTAIQHYLNPTWYVISSVCLAGGLFLIWCNVFYWLAGEKFRCYFDLGIWILAVVMTVDYLFFARDMGTLNSNLQYISGFLIAKGEKLVNLLVIIVLMVLLGLSYKKINKYIPHVFTIASLAFLVMSVNYIFTINKSVGSIDYESASESAGEISFRLSKKGNNVIVLMLDRAIGAYMPYIINEKPELKERLSGFTYYSNTVSFGGGTFIASPALYGGYEYTPAEINKRADVSLKEKQNEALKVMPVLFDENGYEVTVCDPTFANYQWTPDLSIYDDYPDIDTYITVGSFTVTDEPTLIENRKRNFFCYSVMKGTPLIFQEFIYNYGQYYNQSSGCQRIVDQYHAEGISSLFMRNYTTLQCLDDMTEITDDDTDTFLMMSNDTTHEPSMLQEPEYVPSEIVDNTEYEKEGGDRFVQSGVKLKMEMIEHYTHYQVNMATILQLADWMDYLKENEVYDNTRVIIVADHGAGMNQLEGLRLENETDGPIDTVSYYPLLLIKDFDSTEFTVSDEFMTNGDVPTYAFQGLIENPVNPSTGKAVNNDAKYQEKQYIYAGSDGSKGNDNQFSSGLWLSVHDDRWDMNNWEVLNQGILPVEQ